jgi:hypothetical protein
LFGDYFRDWALRLNKGFDSTTESTKNERRLDGDPIGLAETGLMRRFVVDFSHSCRRE